LSRKNQTVRFQKPDYSVFAGLNPLDITYQFTIFSLLSLSLFQEQLGGRPQDPHWRFLGSSMESWSSWVKSSPQEPVSPFPQQGFLHLKVLSLNPQSLCPMDGFEIPLVHYLHSCHRTIPCNISKFPLLNRSNSSHRIESAETGLSGFGRHALVYEFWSSIIVIEILCI
jgi:hypothetical protein